MAPWPGTSRPRFPRRRAPDTVNPSLWRQAQLLSKSGLFQVSETIWQVRGFDVSNITFIKGATGWIVIDPLTTAEVAKAAYDLVTEKLGARPVVAVIYTHSHTDHFGGVKGVISQADVDAGKVQVIAPDGFLEEAVSENVIAGPAMSRRAAYQFGTGLEPGVDGQVSSGIGKGISRGTITLIPPTVSIRETGETLVVDGVKIEFQITPGTEAPAEMNLYFPDLRILCMAENANATMHNVLTRAGAGAGRQGLGRLSDRVPEPLRRPHRRDVHQPRLAAVRRRGGARLPGRSPRRLQIPARPDRADDEPGLCR